MLKPWLRARTIADLDLDMLERSGIRGIIIDVDDTLTAWHGRELHATVADAFGELESRFRIAILSNCGSKRYGELAEIFSGVPIVAHGGNRKPGRAGYREALRLLECQADEAVMIGDRVLTDVYGANRSGIRAILVEAFGTPEPLHLTLVRKAERALLAVF